MAKTTLTEEAFLEPGLKEIGDFKLRPFTLGSVTLCKKLGLSQFTGEKSDEPMDQVEQLRQVAGFLFIHCEPVEKVLRAVRDKQGLEDELLRYQLQIPLSIVPQVMEEIQRVGDMTGAASVEIVEKPARAGGSQESPPGN
jgi:hypothetical protein